MWMWRGSAASLALQTEGSFSGRWFKNPAATKSRPSHLTNMLSGPANKSFQQKKKEEKIIWIGPTWRRLERSSEGESRIAEFRVKRAWIKEAEMIRTTFGCGWVNNFSLKDFLNICESYLVKYGFRGGECSQRKTNVLCVVKSNYMLTVYWQCKRPLDCRPVNPTVFSRELLKKH